MRALSDEDLVEALYEGATHPSALKIALEHAIARVGANGGNIHVVDKSDLTSTLFVASGANYADAAIAQYFNHWRHINPYRAALRRADGVFACHEHLSPRDLSASAYAQDFYFALGERWLAGAVASQRQYEVSLVFNRAEGQKQFDEEEKRLIGALAPHVRRAASLAASGLMSQIYSAGVGAAFAADARPAWMVASNLKIAWMNQAAERVLEEGVLVQACEGRLDLKQASLQARLARAVGSAAHRKLAQAMADTLRVGGGEAALELSVLPATIPAGALNGARSLVLVLGRSCALKRDAAETMGALFKLAPIERGLAIEVAQGSALEDIAARRGVSIETVRSQLRSVFCKTATRRQSELAALVWRTCAA